MSFLNEVKNLHCIVCKGVRDSSLSLRITSPGLFTKLSLLSVKNISIGELSCKNIEVICHTIPELVEIDGLLGLSFLSHFKTIIDYRKQLLKIV